MTRPFSNWNGIQWGCAVVVTICVGFVALLVGLIVFEKEPPRLRDNGPLAVNDSEDAVTLWNGFPDDLRQQAVASGEGSNVQPDDYVGPQDCQACHQQNHKNWSDHPHRWMNAVADSETVKGDFSEKATFEYLGGVVRFSNTDGKHRMHLERDGVTRDYVVTQTIGSRFIQDYVGRLEAGPESPRHPFYRTDHILPFAYSITENEWEPVVNVIHEPADGERPDPFSPQPIAKDGYAVYASDCNYCHTTFALGDMMLRDPELLGQHAPRQLHWDARSYIEEHHSELMPDVADTLKDISIVEDAVNSTIAFDAASHAVTLGISCEACHLGCGEHVANPTSKPDFFPKGQHLLVEGQDVETGRTHDNINWICGRCHSSRNRPKYALGMATWNSIEYSDAMQGSCYSQMTCIKCHEPHTKVGLKWSRTPAQDNESCLSCHQEFESEQARTAHTHHAADSAGSDCMNCHMPRITQGVGGMVRTHAIFSPTNPDMLEANHPNACNMCHTDQSVPWTLSHLKDWYGTDLGKVERSLAESDKNVPAAVSWLQHEDEAVRLVAADAIARSEGKAAVSKLTSALDDPFLINRRYAKRQLQDILGVRLSEFGYQSYMMPKERRAAIEQIESKFGSPTTDDDNQ